MREKVKKLIACLAIATLSLGLSGPAAAVGTSASHRVTIEVPSVNLVQVKGSNTVSLDWKSIPDGLLGTEKSLLWTDRSTTLSWFTNASSATPKKITAELTEALPAGVTLKVRADVSGKRTHGVAVGAQELSTGPIVVVRGIYSELVLDAPVIYEASVTPGAGLGDDLVRTITYTITD